MANGNYDISKIDAWWASMDGDAKLAIMKVFTQEIPFSALDIARERDPKAKEATEKDQAEFNRRKEEYAQDRAEAREALGDLLNAEREDSAQYCPITVHSVARERTKGKNETVYAVDYVELERKRTQFFKEKKERTEAQYESEKIADKLNGLRELIAMGESLSVDIVRIEQATTVQKFLGLLFKERAERRQLEAAEKFNELRVQQFEKLLESTQFIDPNEIVGAKKYLTAIIDNFMQSQRIKKLAKETISGKSLAQVNLK